MKQAEQSLRGVGVGFKSRHFSELMDLPSEVSWLEVHAENYMAVHGETRAQLEALAVHYPISVHGVGLSLAGEQAPDCRHIEALKQLIEWLQPAQVSEHLAWSSHQGVFFNDLLPISYDELNFERICGHIDTVQQALGRPILLENPATYLTIDSSVWHEVDFLSAVAAKTSCGLLLDVNNVYVSAQNQQWDTGSYLRNFNYDAVGEIHLAGFYRDTDALGHELLIDNHGAPIDEEVWRLFEHLCHDIGGFPTLIERDNNIPPCSDMLLEVQRANHVLVSAMNAKVPA